MRIPIAVVGIAHNRRELQAFADAVTLVNVRQLQSGRFPRLYESGIRYRAERRGEPLPGVERFQTVSSSHVVGFDDCDGLASARVAEMLLDGIPARAWVVRSPGIGWHVVALWWDADGRMHVEDPSARLGMLEPRKGHEMEDEIVGVYAEHAGRCVAAVGMVLDGRMLSAVGQAEADDDTRDGRRRARVRAARRALQRLAQRGTALAANLAQAPARAASSAVTTATRAASATARARRAAADIETLDALGVDDDESAEDSIEGIDPIAWSLYVER